MTQYSNGQEITVDDQHVLVMDVANAGSKKVVTGAIFRGSLHIGSVIDLSKDLGRPAWGISLLNGWFKTMHADDLDGAAELVVRLRGEAECIAEDLRALHERCTDPEVNRIVRGHIRLLANTEAESTARIAARWVRDEADGLKTA